MAKSHLKLVTPATVKRAAPKCQAKEPRAPDNVAAVAAANVAKANAFAAAEAPKQSSVAQARDTFRGTGEANISL
jgi:hypothetical protein